MIRFPSGLLGYGLLVLRLALAVAFGVAGVERLAVTARTSPDATLIAALISGTLAVAGGFCVGVGYSTTRAAAGVALGEAGLIVLRVLDPALIGGLAAGATGHLFLAAVAMALALTGPGAYSLDARGYRLREIIIRPRAGMASGSIDDSAQ